MAGQTSLGAYLLRTCARFALLLLAISFTTFALIGLSPIDPVQANIGQAAYHSLGEAKRAQLSSYWGQDTPIEERFCRWAASALQGDFGTSLRFNAPVGRVLAERAGNSLLLLASAWLISGVFGFALGVTAGVKRGSAVDRGIKAVCFVLASTPAFWLGLVMLMLFSVQLGWFPIGFSVPIGLSAADVGFFQMLYHVALPALTLSLGSLAGIALHTREKTIDVMESPYVRFAQARGQSTWQVALHHGLRNAALPALTMQCASIAEVFSGSILVEQVFSYPGLGQAAVVAGLGGDTPLLAGIALVSAVLVFCGNLVANILYGTLDPRMRPAQRSAARLDAGSSTRQLGSRKRSSRRWKPAFARIRPVLFGKRFGTAKDETALSKRWEDDTPNGSSAAAHRFRKTDSLAASGEARVQHRPVRRFVPNRKTLAILATATAILLAAIAFAGAYTGPQAALADLTAKNQLPSWQHPFGTDALGRDMFLRTLAGLSISIRIGLLAAGSSAFIALVLGTIAALGGSKADAVVSWLIDLVMSIPAIMLLILISYAVGKGFQGIVIGIALTHWPRLARIVRAEVLQAKNAPYVAHARKLGRRPWHIARDHILPAVLPQFLIGLILLFPDAILHEASLTFLGFGLSPEQAAIGNILAESMTSLSIGAWWLALLPGIALVASVLLFQAAGSSVRTLVDPRSSQE